MIANSNMFERFAILDAGVASIFDVKSGELETIIQNCNSFQLTTKSSSKDVKEQGEIAMSFSMPMEGTLKFNAETTSFQQLSLALGSAGLICNTETAQYQKTQDFVVTNASSVVFTLEAEAKDASNVFIKLATRDGEVAKKLAFTLGVDNKTVTVTPDPDIALGDNIKIVYNTMMPVGKLYSFKVPSKGKNFTKRIVIDVLGTNRNDQSPMLMQFDIHKCAVNNGVDITMDAENPSKFSIELKVLSDATRKYDADTNGFFDVLMPVEDDDIIVPSITDLALTALDDSISTTFSPATGGTNVKLQYKKSTDSVYTDASNVLNATSTGATITALTDATSYNVRLAFDVSGSTYYSNVATITTL